MAERTPPKPDFLSEEEWNALIATRDPNHVRVGAPFHVKLYQETNGGEGTDMTQGGPTLLLTGTGRKSRKEFTVPLNYMPIDGTDDVIVVGSIAGLEKHPFWALNLASVPRGVVQIHARKYPVTAQKLTPEEKAERWPALTKFFPLWGHFQKYCDREFMVFLLSPAKEEG